MNGIGTALSGKLSKIGIHTIGDLLFHLPYRYQDRTRITPIIDTIPEEWCVVRGEIINVEVQKLKKPLLNCTIYDNSESLSIKFFYFNPSLVQALKQATHLKAFGEIRLFKHQKEMMHPEIELSTDETICTVEETLTPIYGSTQGLTQHKFRHMIHTILKDHAEELAQLEWMNEDERQKLNLPHLHDALALVHQPSPETSQHTLENGSHPAIKRLVLDELLAKHISLQYAKAERLSQKAPQFLIKNDVNQTFFESLPFTLTDAQKKSADDITQDLSLNTPMFRLVQGDVGCGKTIVAAFAALQAHQNGYQTALMAPTDLLTEQHEQNFSAWFKSFGIKCLRLSGKMTTKERKYVMSSLQEGDCHIVIGTHALFQKDVTFKRLGLVIIDEQHRFGVQQRHTLQEKGYQEDTQPHQLMLTATPIPRTLAMSYFSHLDISLINELPKGRQPTQTAIISENKRETIIERLLHAIENKRQVYWVCTLIEESETLQCQTATQTHIDLQKALPSARVGLIHGRLKQKEKDAIMQAFKEHSLDLLVATTVIEVGVDVPNASLMIIENAERLGLSQLHQLRGRVGRGQDASHCILMYRSPLSLTTQERLITLRDTNDGFVIAEKDLQLRGYGEVLGKQQTGHAMFRVASLPRDEHLYESVHNTYASLLKHDPVLSKQIMHRWLGDAVKFHDA